MSVPSPGLNQSIHERKLLASKRLIFRRLRSSVSSILRFKLMKSMGTPPLAGFARLGLFIADIAQKQNRALERCRDDALVLFSSTGCCKVGHFMEIVLATLWIYRVAFKRTLQLLSTNLPVIFAPLIYSVILSLVTTLFSGLWLIGGIIVTAVTAACASSALYLIENIVRAGKVSVGDFTKGFS